MSHLSKLRASFLAFCPLFAADDLLLNRIGYELTGPKTAVVRSTTGSVAATGFEIIDANGKTLMTGSASASQSVPGWGKSAFKVLDFSTISDTGRFLLKTAPGGDTAFFTVARSNLLRVAGPAVVGYFTAMRNLDAGDAKIGYFGEPARGTHDVHGGWNDATGDDGKYLSHLNYANFMNPQQIPMVAWSLLRTRLLAPATTESFKDQIFAEAAWGADYLLRVQDTAGYFYINVFREKWSLGNAKTICAWVGDSASQGNSTSDYQSAWREGGGIPIAALALAARRATSILCRILLSSAKSLRAAILRRAASAVRRNMPRSWRRASQLASTAPMSAEHSRQTRSPRSPDTRQFARLSARMPAKLQASRAISSRTGSNL